MSLKTIPERFIPLKLPPGLYHNGTKYEAKGRWYNASLVRFYGGMRMPVGGWKNVLTSANANIQVTGAPRGAWALRNDAGSSWLATGTQTKAYAYSDGTLTDITPAGFTSGVIDGGYAVGAYGAGLYGAGPYGSGTGGVTLKAADTWQFDNLGQILVACFTADGRILQSSPISTQMTVCANSPTGALGVVVTPERFLVALGAFVDPSNVSHTDARVVSWASQGTVNVWAPNAALNTAGAWQIQARGRLIAGRRTKNQTLLWTEAELFAMIYVGPPLLYTVQPAGVACGLIAPNAVAMVGDTAFWMGTGKFHAYNGQVSDIPCDVQDVVFPSAANLASGTQINTAQRSKTFAVTNATFHEVTWYYASAAMTNGTEPDRYVTYNYVENHWTVGALARCSGVDRDVFENPLLLDSSGFLYEHEVGSAMPGVAQLPFIESGPIEFSSAYGPYMMPTSGDQVFRVERYLPDEGTLGDLKTTLYVAMNPTDVEATIGPFTNTAPTTVRATGRQVRVRYDQVNATAWRLGVPRLGLIPGGLR